MTSFPWDRNRQPAGQPAGPTGQQPAPTRAPAPGGMTIVQLTASNVKRLQAVTIRPDGNVVVLGGRNGQGKTSVLDAIEYALGGKAAICAEPVRRGQDQAEVVCDLGDLVVQRTFTSGGGSSLHVMTRDGLRYPSPQKVLDELVGRLTFDPLAFARQPEKEQAETLRKLVGLDFTDDEKRRDLVFSERTQVNREVKALKARIASIPEPKDAPTAAVSAADVARELEEAHRHNAVLAAVETQVQDVREYIKETENDIREMNRQLAEARAKLERLLQSEGKAPIPIDPIRARIAQADDHNRRFHAARQWHDLNHELLEREAKADDLTQQLDLIARRQADKTAATRMPVDGLGISPDGVVTFGGLPLSQASAAEQLRVSVAVAIALNPKLRVLLIRDASLLDSQSLAMVAQMAEQAGAQVWLERVEQDSATTVVIEDGTARDVTQAEGGAA